MLRKERLKSTMEALQDGDVFVKGPRGAGKTEIAAEMRNLLKKKNYELLSLTFSKEEDRELCHNAESFMRSRRVQEFLDKPTKKKVIICERIQYLENPGNLFAYIRRLLPANIRMVIFTSAYPFKADALDDYSYHPFSWMKHMFYWPYSWKEYLKVIEKKPTITIPLSAGKKDLKEAEAYFAQHGPALEDHMAEFMHWGGYPRVIREKSPKRRKEVLGQIFENQLEFLRYKRLSGHLQDEYNEFLKLLAHYNGRNLNIHRYVRELNIHRQTFTKFMYYAAAGHQFEFPQPFYSDPEREMSKRQRIYCTDFGLYSYLTDAPLETPAVDSLPVHLFHTFVHMEALKTEQFSFHHFYRTIAKSELSFVGISNGKLVPTDLQFHRGKQTEGIILRNFVERYKKRVARPVVITRDDLRATREALFVPITLFPMIDFKA